MSNDNFDWMKWAGITETDSDIIRAEAKKYNIPISDLQSEQDVFNRVFQVRTYRFNRNISLVSIVCAIISCCATVVTVVSLVFLK